MGVPSSTSYQPVANILNSNITISNMPGSFLLSGFNISGAVNGGGVVTFLDNTGAMTVQDMVIQNTHTNPDSVGLSMVQKGAITLTRVNSSYNGESAAMLNNSSGSGGITITNGDFNSNTGNANAALRISSKGAIVLNNVSAWGNSHTGVAIASTKSITIKNSNFHHNTYDGLNVAAGSLGSLTLENVYVLNNLEDGADITLGGL